MPDRDDIAVLQGMFLDQLTVNVGTVGAVEVFQKRIIQDIDDQRVMSAHGRIIDTHIVIR